MKKIASGIDFGTSNTTMAVATDTHDHGLINLEGAHLTMPSAIFFRTTDIAAAHINAALGRTDIDAYDISLGRSAIQAYLDQEEGRLIRSFKRALGTSLMKEGTLVGDRWLDFPDMATLLVKEIKKRTERQVGQETSSIVVGRPVRFVENDTQKDALAQDQLKSIFEAAGYREVAFQYEPIAAAFSHEARLGPQERLACVMDIGGGTSDFTVIKLSSRYVTKPDRTEDILANSGARIGGNDFDRNFSLSSFMPLIGLGSSLSNKDMPFPSSIFHDLSEWSKVQFAYAPKRKREISELFNQSSDKAKVGRLVRVLDYETGHQLLGDVEAAKIVLASQQETQSDLGYLEKGLVAVSSRRDFEDAISAEAERIRASVQECVDRAQVKKEDIDLVILTGGGTGIPLIQRIAQSEFKNAELSTENMLTSVGLGLGVEARRLFLGKTGGLDIG